MEEALSVARRGSIGNEGCQENATEERQTEGIIEYQAWKLSPMDITSALISAEPNCSALKLKWFCSSKIQSKILDNIRSVLL